MTTPFITPNKIIQDVEQYYGLTDGELKAYGRTTTLSKARRVAMYLAKHCSGLSWEEVGDTFHRHTDTAKKTLRSIDDIQYDINHFIRQYTATVVDVDTWDFNELTLCAFRYALGRRSYITGSIASHLLKYKNMLDDKTKKPNH